MTGSIVTNLISWLFGIAVFAVGIINTFWGNDPFFGIFLLLLAFVYFPTGNIISMKITGHTIYWLLKVLLGIFIFWAVIGVGQLGDKIDLMMMDIEKFSEPKG
jgi:hypothetical protein